MTRMNGRGRETVTWADRAGPPKHARTSSLRRLTEGRTDKPQNPTTMRPQRRVLIPKHASTRLIRTIAGAGLLVVAIAFLMVMIPWAFEIGRIWIKGQ